MIRGEGIGMDEQTALLAEPDGSDSRVGEGAACFLRTLGGPETCLSRTPLIFRDLSVYRIGGPAAFNLSAWRGNGGTAYLLSAENGVLTSTQANGAIY